MSATIRVGLLCIAAAAIRSVEAGRPITLEELR